MQNWLKLNGTLVFLMGISEFVVYYNNIDTKWNVRRYGQLLLLQEGTTARQRTVTGTLYHHFRPC